MGVMIINSAVSQMFDNRSSMSEDLGSTLETLMSLKTDNKLHPDFTFWEGVNVSSVSLKDFLDFVVQPFVAMLLIVQDLKLGEKEAEETLL